MMLWNEPGQFRLWAAVLAIFLIGIVLVSFGIRRQTTWRNILHNLPPCCTWLVVALIVTVQITGIVFQFAFKVVVNFLRDMLLDIATFPSSLVVRHNEKEDDGDLCRLVLGCFPTLVVCPQSLESPADIDFSSCNDEPPSQIGPFLEALELPENVWIREPYEACAWKRFHILVSYPWLWLHTKYLMCVLFLVLLGPISICYDVLSYIFHPRELLLALSSFSLGSILGSALGGLLGCFPLWSGWFLIQHYWLHVYHRSTQRVCNRWAESFRQRGLLVDFCFQHEQWVGWVYYILPKEKCYIRFRHVRLQQAHRDGHFSI